MKANCTPKATKGVNTKGKKHKQFKSRYIRTDTRYIINLTIPFSVDIINADYFTLDSKRIKLQQTKGGFQAVNIIGKMLKNFGVNAKKY